jgi:hypothetical protein
VRKIFKYVIKIGNVNKVVMPSRAKILSVQMQGNELCIWAMVWDDNPDVVRTFVVRSTGEPLRDVEAYVGTVQNPPYVWHVFEHGSAQ